VRLFSLLGMYLFALSVTGAIVLIRWRALIPLFFLVFLGTQLGARLIGYLHPTAVAATGTTFGGHAIGFWVNLGVLSITAIGFVLSVIGRDTKPLLAKEV
jgi:hypothetical protein